jgi:hypothetical protein
MLYEHRAHLLDIFGKPDVIDIQAERSSRTIRKDDISDDQSCEILKVHDGPATRLASIVLSPGLTAAGDGIAAAVDDDGG